MDIFVRIWELISAFFLGLVNTFDSIVTSAFGSSNKRQVDKYLAVVEQINALEQQYQVMSDDELGRQTTLFQERLKAGQTLDDIRNEAFAVVQEAGKSMAWNAALRCPVDWWDGIT